MPRKSLQRQLIDAMFEKVQKLRFHANLRNLMVEEDSIEDDRLIHQTSVLKKMIRSRYLFRSKFNRKDRAKFDLEDALSYDSKNYNDEEFLFAFRLTRESFFLLMIEGWSYSRT